EVPVAYAVDELNIRRGRAVWLVAGVIFLIGIPSLLSNGASIFWTEFITYRGAESPTDFMTFIGHVANDSFLPLGGCLIVSFAAFVWKKHNLNDEIAQGYAGYKGSFVESFLNFTITFVAPTILGLLFIFSVLSTFFGIHIIG
ncbi:MAG: sodium-dependent transporter, partial [Cyclobacteriaceae bacterium]|nr:sodium-dependent transporter [Cyclobacteriaceae bacterium]